MLKEPWANKNILVFILFDIPKNQQIKAYRDETEFFPVLGGSQQRINVTS
jgi:hypothetical protein